jgi:hypothetical protein
MSQPANVVTPLSPNWRTNPKTRLEFVLALVERYPSAKIAPIGQGHLASRDLSVIEDWELQEVKTEIHGVRLKPGSKSDQWM